MVTLERYASGLIKKIKHNYDCVIIIESGGVKGTGKTSFSIGLAMEICRQLGFTFLLEDIMIFDPTSKKIIEKVRDKPDYFPIIVDEGSKTFYKRNWAKEPQKELMQFVNVIRKFHKIVLINNPSFYGLDKDLLELADYRISIIKRGIALVFCKDLHPDSKDKWCRDRNLKYLANHPRNIRKAMPIINIMKKAPNYLGLVNFGPIEPELFARYESMSKKQELKSFEESIIDSLLPQSRWEGAMGLVEFFNERNNGDKLSAVEIASVINKFADRSGLKGFTTEQYILNTLIHLRSENFSDILKEKLESKHPKLFTTSA